MKRRVNATTADSTGRVLDYSLLMNEKENQIVELEKKIQNLEEKLRKSSKREGELENEIVRLTAVIKSVNNANVTKTDLERLCNGVVEYERLS
jgi:helix-turn-helix protein